MTGSLIPTDGAVIAASDLEAAIARMRARKSCEHTQTVRFFDFDAYGKPFTQAAIVFTPAEPLMIEGRRVVVIASEGGSDNGRGFVADYTGRDGLGTQLAKKGVTFIALCRLGRWNFLSDEPLGSWMDVPIETRMPVFWRGQPGHWPAEAYVTTDASGVSSPTGSTMCRVAAPSTELERHMAALTPTTSMKGFETAIAGLVDLSERDKVMLLFYGFSTGGTFLWSLAKRLKPEGVLGYGSASFPVAYFSYGVVNDNFRWLYDRSTFRVRMRGLTDFTFFNKELPEDERLALWKEALHAPRFKSHEDTFMFFNVAALSESVGKLWNQPYLPSEVRERGFAALLKENLDLCFPDEALAPVSALDLFGTKDEILPPPVATQAASVVRPYCRQFRQAFLPGYHHAISADHAEAFSAVWLDAAEAGFFGPNLAAA